MKKFILIFITMIIIVFTTTSASAFEHNNNIIADNYDSISNINSYLYAYSGYIPHSSNFMQNSTYSISSDSTTLYTTDGSPVLALDYSWREVDEDRADAEVEGYADWIIETVDETYTYDYNCHYYAWCADWCQEFYWIPSAKSFVDDVHTYTLDENEDPQIGDIVTYWVDGDTEHSAIVYDIEDEEIICISKWGALGIYIHKLDDVPSSYKANGVADVKYHRYAHGEHDLSIEENNGDNGHIFKCSAEKTVNGMNIKCSYTTECDGEVTVTYVNSSCHYIYCSDCSYSAIKSHQPYTFIVNGPNGTIIRCYDCTYSLTCPHEALFVSNSSSGHQVGCPSGCFLIFEEHSFIYYQDSPADLYCHVAECEDCGAEYSLSHNWESVLGGYECTDCGQEETAIPGIMSLSDDELERYLSSLNDDELESFIALLPEDTLARVMALLPSEDDSLTE